MVLIGRHAMSIGGGLTLEEVQANDVMGRFSLLPLWKAGRRCRSHDVCVVGIATSLHASCCLALRLRPRRHSLPDIVEQPGTV